MSKLNRTALVALCALFPLLTHADQGSITNTGSVASPAGTLTISGTALTYISADGTTAINATFTTSSSVESCSGGGRGGHVTCGITFTGSFTGTLTVNGVSQAISGVTNQYGAVGGASSGTTAYNSAYTPFYFSNSEQILRSDDINGTNLISFGSQGSGVGQFYGAYGIALDSLGRIYVADTYNCRIVRMDDMNGKNWTVYGGNCGSGPGLFSDPSGIAVDASGKIYVMDSGNSQVVRMDDMSGANWVAYGSPGSGTGQFAQWLQSIAVDSSSRIYVADTGNKRIVRIDDMTGTNWTALTQSQPINGATDSFDNPQAVAVGQDGKIYVADDEYYQPAVVRVDDMAGTNWTGIYLGASAGPHSIAVDAAGTVFTGGGGAQLTDNMAAVIQSGNNICVYGCYYVFGLTPIPLPSPRPSAISFSPSTLSFTQNVGTTSTQPITVTNFGGTTLDIQSISASAGFGETDNCIGQIVAGSTCTVTVSYTPTATGSTSGSIVVSDDSGNAGSTQTIVLSGTGTAPIATLTPTAVSFSSQVLGTTSTTKTVTLSNTGTGPMLVTSVSASGPFNQTNTCTASIAPAGTCAILVSFTPAVVGSASGALTFAGNAGTQIVSLTGTGSAPVTFSSSSLSFGTVAVGNISAAKTVTVTNREKVTLNFSSFLTSSGFAVASNTCGASVAAGASCTIGVTFSPIAVGSATGTLTVTDDALNSPQTVGFTGIGSAPVTLSVASLSFSSTAVGNSSSAKTVTLTNHQGVALNFGSILASAGFAVSSNSCGASIAAGGTCTVGVTFSPIATGSAAGSLTIGDDAPGSPQTVSLTGTGTSAVTLSSNSLSFGTVTVGHTSSAKTVTLTNHEAVSFYFTSIVTSNGFAISSNTCGASVAAGASCTVGVTFTPAVAGAASGTLTFNDSALAGNPQTVGLSGTGH